MRTIADARTVFYLGDGFQPALEDAIESASAHAVDLLGAVKTRPGGEEGAPTRTSGSIRSATRRSRSGSATSSTRGRGPSASPRGCARSTRSSAAASELRARGDRDESAFFGYLAERYGLKQVAITGISPEAEPTPRDLEDVVRRVRDVGATTVFFETLVSPRLAETVAREVGATTAVLDPLEGLTEDQVAAGADYFDVMRANLAALKKALACR